MNKRRALVIASASLGFITVTVPAWAQKRTQPNEASLRDAIANYVKVWNRHDVKAWSNMLTEDIWYTETTDFYERTKGKKPVLATFADNVKKTDLGWEIVRLRMMPNNTATVVLRHVSLVPPKKDGKYKMTLESDPSLSRWRHEGGQWKMYYFTTHKGTALDAMKKDGVD